MYGALKASSPAGRLTNMVAAVIAAIAVLAAIAPACAADPTAASMVVDANTGAVLHNRSGDEKVYPASLTKMMTLYMAFELIELGRLDYDSKIKMTQEGADAAPSKLDLEPGEELTVLNAIKALVTKSANDVAIALAMHIGGTETNFARLMTRKAREIGMSNTTFRNASGLPDPEQTTTARDMITLGLRLQDDFPRQYRLFSTRTFTYGGKNYRNHNTLLGRYEGTDGIKTGYTRASGFNLVSSVRRNGKHVVAAVFGGDTARARNAKMQSILNAALAKASTSVTRKPALVARAPQPARAAKPPVEVAEASRAAEPPPPAAAAPAPAVRERETSIAVAKVRAVRIGEDARAPRVERTELNPSPAQPVFAVAGAGGSMPPARDAGEQSQAFPRFVPETGALQPSTLQAQAAQLEGANYAPAPAPRPVAALAPETPRAPAARNRGARGPFEIQIGAFGDSAEAERRMAAARQRAGGILDPYRSVAIPVQSGSTKLYRARFRGFDASAANHTCTRLRTLQIDCFVIKTE
jgi:D-alanyl-D-alanine carboxypeptidase